MSAAKMITIIVFALLCLLSSCGRAKEPVKASKEQIITEYSKNYDISEKTDDGQYVLSITAPDYGKILKKLSNSGDSEISLEKVYNEIQSNPEEMKTYYITVDELSESTVSHSFEDAVSRDLLIDAIMQNDYKEGGLS